MTSHAPTRPRVVIVGGSFGGLSAGRALARADVRLTLVDRTNHHIFQPLLYQVATATLAPSDITAPVRHLVRTQRNTEVLMAEATGVDVVRRIVQLDREPWELAYEHLILAAGTRHSYFGHDKWEALVPGVAPAANQMGRTAAMNLTRAIARAPRRTFRYRDRGNLATIGRYRAVADFGRVRLTGVIAWWFWLFVHIMYLVGFRNRASVLVQWAYAYFTYQRGVRLIVGARSPESAESAMDGASRVVAPRW